jgi:RNA polymerase sigma-70 factor (ECF subfamily)
VSSCIEPGAEALPAHKASSIARLGERHSFRLLYQQHFDEIMGFVLRFGIRPHEAEDIVQRVFIVALRRSEQAEAIEQPSAWLRAVALRVVHEYFRWWKVRYAGVWLLEQSWAGRLEQEVDPERDALANESLRRVRSVLRRMSCKLRDAFVLLDIEGLSPREAAGLLGISHNTMRSRHILAREEFKRLWQRNQGRKERSDD